MRPLLGAAAALALAAGLAGCTMSIPVARPTPSGLSYSGPRTPPVTLKVVDARAGEELTFHVLTAGLSGSTVRLDGMDAPVTVLAENLAAELEGRGYPVKVLTDPAASADVELRVTRYRIVSRQIPGFGPWEAMHQFRATLVAGPRQRTIHAYFFNSKRPLTGARDLRQPCFDLPQSILVKEIASKVNRAALGFQAGEATVDELVRRARSKEEAEGGPWLELVELGGTDNPGAMEALKRYTGHRDELVRAVAYDAIGMLGPERELPFLEGRFGSRTLETRELVMALKAIGDAGDAGDTEAADLVRLQTSHEDYDDEAGLRYLVDLYSGR